MKKEIFNCLGIHQSFKLHGSHWYSFGSCRRSLVVFIIATISVLTSLAQTPLNETEVYERIMARKNMEGYTQGTPWDDSNHRYTNTVEFFGYRPGSFSGTGCYAFMMDMMEYASNYEYPIRRVNGSYNNLPEIHIGDGVRLKNNTHSVVVIGIDDDGHTVTVAEGNLNSAVYWGRKIDLADPDRGFTYLATFWPEPEPISQTISAIEYATFYYSNSAYRIPEGVEAYIVEGINGNVLTLKSLEGVIPKGCAVILKGPQGTYDFVPAKDTGNAVENNMLRGSDEQEMTSGGEMYYKLTVKNGKVGFYWGAEEGGAFENDAHKAYLSVGSEWSNGFNGLFFDTTTSIDNMMATGEDASRAIYNLSGQRVNESYKGVVIINGKKVLRK